jgi:hypothetical protein
MSHDDGWIVETGTSMAHFRQHRHRLCKPKKQLRGVFLNRAILPAERCPDCVQLLDEEMASDAMR